MKSKIRNSLIILFVVAVIGYIAAQQTMNSDLVISPNEARTQLKNDSTIVLLDVRTPEEHLAERIGNTPLIPVNDLENRIHELDLYKNCTIIVYCRSGNRSGTATTILRKHGFKAMNMQGGIHQWKSEHFDTTNGPIQ